MQFLALTRPSAACRARVVLLGCLALCALTPRGLDAHAELLRSVPAAGAVITTAPTSVRLTFSEPVEATGDAIIVLAPDGTRVDGGDASVPSTDRMQAAVGVRATARGTYSVRWSVVSADGHPITGRFEFSLGVPSTPAAGEIAAPPAPSQAPLALHIAGRWLHLIALAFGAAPLVLLPIAGGHADARRLWRVARLGVVWLVPAAVLQLAGQLLALHGTTDAAFTAAAASSLIATRWGLLWSARLGLSAAFIGLTFWSTGEVPARGRLLLSGGVLAALLVATALNGHSAATNPILLSVGIDWLHLAATVAWIGGLAGLAFVALPAAAHAVAAADVAQTTSGRPGAGDLARLISRFSTLALVCVEALIVTGLYHTWAHVDAPEALTSTAYGLTLLAKGALIALIMAPAAVNLLVIKPRLAALAASGSGAIAEARLFRRLVGSEVALGIAILVAAAALTSLPPARLARPAAAVAAAAPEAPALTLADNAGPIHVQLAITPADVGSNQIRITLQDSAAASTTAPALRLRIEPPPDSGVSPWTVTPAAGSDGLTATVSLAPAGQWRLQALVDSHPPATFSLRVPMRGAGELLAHADDAMNRVRSVVEQREVAAAAGKTASVVTYEAPDRLHRTSGDEEDIVIGEARFMHHGTMWHKTTAESGTWPRRSTLATAANDVTLLGIEDVEGAPATVLGWLDTRDGSRNRAWIRLSDSLVVRHLSVLPGRTIDRRYTQFNRAPRIVAPAAAQ